MISFSPTEALKHFFADLLQKLHQHPGSILATVIFFIFLQYFFSTGTALFWAVLLLTLLINLPAQPFLMAALLALVLTPALYFLDRPAQAERVGVMVFSLLALGSIINLTNTWRSKQTNKL